MSSVSVITGRAHRDLHSLGKRFMWRCHYCRRVVHCGTCDGSKTDLHATRDHYNPRSNGGPGRGANIVLACWRCNQDKQDAVPDDRRGCR